MTDEKIIAWLDAEFAASEAHSRLWAEISKEVEEEFPHISIKAVNIIIASRIDRRLAEETS
jgi:hypothetical protein